MRAAWRPTGEAFFGRMGKAQLLHLLTNDLEQPEEAARLASGRKADIVDHLERLSAAPFAALAPDQREAALNWCPLGMAIPAPRERERGPSADAAQDDAAETEDDADETFEVDPDEEFAIDDEDLGRDASGTEAA